MTLSAEDILFLQMAKNSDDGLVRTLYEMSERIRQLDARIQQLEMREAAAKTTLRVVNDGHG
jgi:phage shock protein A